MRGLHGRAGPCVASSDAARAPHRRDARRHAAALGPAQCRHGDARGLEVSPSSLHLTISEASELGKLVESYIRSLEAAEGNSSERLSQGRSIVSAFAVATSREGHRE
jgi:hypothetical protein